MILASASPRRARILDDMGMQAHIIKPQVEERRRRGEPPVDYARRMAQYKALWAFMNHPDETADQTVIAADTVVWNDDGRIFDKPADWDEAKRMLGELSGKVHHVTTGVCIVIDGTTGRHWRTECTLHDTTDVEFYDLSENDIMRYVSTNEPMDKAGGYGIQGQGRLLVRSITGDYYNVVGLPIAKVMRKLDTMQAGIADPTSYWF